MDHASSFSTGLAASSTVKYATAGLSPVAAAFADWCCAVRTANAPGIPDSACDAACRVSTDAVAKIAGFQSRSLFDLRMKLHAFQYETTAGPSQAANALFDSVLSDVTSLADENLPASATESNLAIEAAPAHPCWSSEPG